LKVLLCIVFLCMVAYRDYTRGRELFLRIRVKQDESEKL